MISVLSPASKGHTTRGALVETELYEAPIDLNFSFGGSYMGPLYRIPLSSKPHTSEKVLLLGLKLTDIFDDLLQWLEEDSPDDAIRLKLRNIRGKSIG